MDHHRLGSLVDANNNSLETAIGNLAALRLGGVVLVRWHVSRLNAGIRAHFDYLLILFIQLYICQLLPIQYALLQNR